MTQSMIGKCRAILGVATLYFLQISSALAETIARCGQGWLEKIDGYPVLHLKGTHYEMGFQHGALMKANVQENANFLLKKKGDVELAALGPIII